LKRGGVKISSVLGGSIADEAGIEPGDAVLSINGEDVRDMFDYRFLATCEELTMEVQKPDGGIWRIDIEKGEYEDLGIELKDSVFDQARSCANKCIFCFIDQLPDGMRESLYFKDDDMRLSFLTGNYVTLTNVGAGDIDRIIRYRMSPVNVSVHTTNPDLRVFMLKNRSAGDVLDKIRRLADGGITLNCQIVLCRDLNDGDELERTVSDLSALYPGINSVSVVPVGITSHRKGLYPLVPYDRETALGVVRQVELWQDRLMESLHTRLVFLADEFYILAGLDIPGYEAYEDFPQLENGVGLIAQLRREFEEKLGMADFERKLPARPGRHVSIATGVFSYEFIKDMAGILESKFDGLKVDVHKIKNDYFGENVTVTGLLTGRDIISQLAGKDIGEELLLCRCMFKYGEDLFLDDCSLTTLEEKLGVKATVVENSGCDFIEKVLGAGR